MRFRPLSVRKVAGRADDLIVVDGQRFFTPNRLMAMMIVLLSVLVYIPCLSGLPIWDDRAILTGWGIGGGETWQQCFTKPFLGHYYRPFTSLSYWLDEHFLGKTPLLLHQTNLILHAVATVLVILLTRALLNRPRLALLAGLIFAIQPAQVTTIAWIGGRCDQLGAMLMIATALSLVRYHQTNRWPCLVVGTLAFFSAMMVKEQFALLVFTAPVLAFALRPREERLRQAIWTTMPFAIAGAAFVVLWLAHFPDPNGAAAFGVGEQISRLGRAMFNYTLLFVAPNPWSMHIFSLETLRNPAIVAIGLALFVAMFIAVRVLWRRDRRLGMLAAVTAFGYLPVSNLVPMPSLLAAPYRVGVICPFVAILLAVAVASLYRSRRMIPAYGLGLCALSGFVLTPWGASKWTDEATWFATTVQYDPGTLSMHGCLANAYEAEKNRTAALAETEFVLDKLFTRAGWQNYKSIPTIVAHDSKLPYRLLSGEGFKREPAEEVSMLLALRGHVLVGLNRDNEGAEALKTALELQPSNHKAWFELAQLARSHNRPETMKLLRMAYACGPKDSVGASLLAREYLKRGLNDRAYAVLSRVPEMRPEFGEPLLDLAEMQLARGKREEAMLTLAQASKTIVDVSRLHQIEAKLDRRVASR